MTTITLNKTYFKNSVALAAKYAPKQGDFANQITLSANDGLMNIQTTDNIESVCVREIEIVNDNLTEEASFEPFSVDVKNLHKALKSFKSENITLEIQEQQVTLKNKKKKVKLPIFEEVFDISFEAGDSKELLISNGLSEKLSMVQHAIDTNNPRFELNGVLLSQSKGKLNIVSTDTTRLPVTSLDSVSNDDFEIILPRKGAESIIKLFSGYNLSAKITEESMFVETANVLYSVKLINGKYPEYQRIIPQSSEKEVEINKLLLKDLVESASILSNDIIIDVKGNTIIAKSNDGNVEVNEELKDNSSNIKFAITADKVLDFLNATLEEDVMIQFNGANMPIVFKTDSLQEVVMPLVLNETSEEEEVQEDVA